MTALDSPDTPRGRRSPRLIVDFFEPRPFGSGIAAGEDLTARPSRPEMAPQRIDNIESAPENGMVSEASGPQDVVYGRAACRALRDPKDDRVERDKSCRKRRLQTS
jgi:hypothetical protein